MARTLQDKAIVGWLAWPAHVELYLAAPPGKSSLLPWDPQSKGMNEIVRDIALTEAFWKALSGFFAEENHADSATQDNISCVKSICTLKWYFLPILSDFFSQSNFWKKNL